MRNRPGVAVLFVAVLLAGVGTAGCVARGELDEGPAYPQDLPPAETLDVHAFRRGTDLELTNTTGRRFGPGMLWLNARYGCAIEGLDVGQRLRLPLDRFVDAQGRRFGAGGFFAADRPELLALVELTTQDDAGRPIKLGLIAVGTRR